MIKSWLAIITPCARGVKKLVLPDCLSVSTKIARSSSGVLGIILRHKGVNIIVISPNLPHFASRRLTKAHECNKLCFLSATPFGHTMCHAYIHVGYMLYWALVWIVLTIDDLRCEHLVITTRCDHLCYCFEFYALLICYIEIFILTAVMRQKPSCTCEPECW